MGYPPHFGTPRLIEKLKYLAFRHSGHTPKHLVITCGATGAVNAALYALSTNRTDWVVTEKHYYPIYPAIIDMTDMIQIDKAKKAELIISGLSEHNFISLSASPSNPEGLVCPFDSVDIYDAAYASKTYSSGGHIPVKWKVMAGSLSKTLGLAGLRLGWASTDDDDIAHSLEQYVKTHYVGLSSVSMRMAEKVLDLLDLDAFEKKSAKFVDDNREEVQKILTKFGRGDVPSRGMFAILELGKTERKALEKAKIKWQPGSTWGANDDWARLSLGQDRELVKKAVKEVLKNDKRK
jgi:aspartate/methionine/tyrosine aminotransferase